MDERMLRLLDTIQSFLVSPARSPAEQAQEDFLARYPRRQIHESRYDFNLRINAFKTPSQILAEIELRGARDYYCEYKKIQRQSYPSGDTYVTTVQEMRLLLRTKQLTEPVIVALLANDVPLRVIYDAMNEFDQPSIYSKAIALAAVNGCVENLSTLMMLYLGKFRWDVHGHCFDQEVMIAALGRVPRNEFNEIFRLGIRSKTFDPLLDECKKEIRAGRAGNQMAKGHVLEDEMGI
jgi:hypothetical protein